MTVPMIKSIGDVPYPIDTHSDAFSPLLTAGAALGITGEATDSAAWLERTSTSDGPTTVKSIKGNTLVWNQLVNAPTTSVTESGVTMTPNQDGSVTLDGTATGNSYFNVGNIATVSGHKYLMKGCPANGSASTYFLGIAGSATDTGSGGIQTGYTLNTSIRFSFKEGVTFDNVEAFLQCFDLTQMFGAGNEPSTVAEFEALFPEAYYEYDAGSLLSVNMTGIETTGFNQWDEEWELGGYSTVSGNPIAYTDRIRSKNPIPVFSSTEYCVRCGTSVTFSVNAYDADGAFISNVVGSSVGPDGKTFTTPANARYIKFSPSADYGTIYKHDICINLSWSGRRNGEYEAYWKAARLIDVATYFPDGMRSAGTVRDELTSTEAITRVGVVDLGSLTWQVNESWGGYRAFYTADLHSVIANHTSYATVANIECVALAVKSRNDLYGSDADGIAQSAEDISCRYSGATTAADFKAAMSGVMLYYALATPTVTPIDPPLNLSYRVDDFGTERVMVPTGENSAPPTIVAAQGYTAESLRDAALSAIAPVENGTASTNYGVGSYLIHDGQLCKVTTAIATGEAITIGTNVTATTVMAEVIALIAQ